MANEAVAASDEARTTRLPRQGPFSFLELMRNSMKLWWRTLAQVLLISLLFLLISVTIQTFIMTNGQWGLYTLAEQLQPLADKMAADPQYQMTSEEAQLMATYRTMYTSHSLMANFLLYLIPFGTMMFSSRYLISTIRRPEHATIAKSFKAPLVVGKWKTSIFILLLVTFLTPVGISLMIVPGFIVMMYGLLPFFSLTIDSNLGKNCFSHARSLISGNAMRVLGVVIVGMIFITITSGVMVWVNNSTQFNPANYKAWLEPDNRQYVPLFIFNFLRFGIVALFGSPFASLVAYSYQDLLDRSRGVGNLPGASERPSGSQQVSDDNLAQDEGPILIKLQVGQRQIHCPKCGAKQKVNRVRCYKCSQLFRFE